MSIIHPLQNLRDWFPVPRPDGRIAPLRWILLEGNRNAVTAALLSLVFAALMAIGSLWTFEMANILTETPAIENILDTLLSGIILLVSIVVSINSIVLSHDITSVGTQEDRLKATMSFRQDVGRLTEDGRSPTNPAAFIELMSDVITERAAALEAVVDGIDEDFAQRTKAYAIDVTDMAAGVDTSFTNNVSGAEFGVLWLGLDLDYSQYMDRSRTLRTAFDGPLSSEAESSLEELTEAFQLFSMGKEYFKTLYYSQEISELSRTLLVVSLPAILINASAILAINAEALPEFWVFGLPPLLTFVAAVFTISLMPFVILTSYMLRLATVAKRTTAAGPFSLEG